MLYVDLSHGIALPQALSLCTAEFKPEAGFSHAMFWTYHHFTCLMIFKDLFKRKKKHHEVYQ